MSLTKKELNEYEEAGKKAAHTFRKSLEDSGFFEGEHLIHEKPGPLEQIRLEIEFRHAMATETKLWGYTRTKALRDAMGGPYYPQIRKLFKDRCVLCNRKVRRGRAWYYGLDDKCALLCEKCVIDKDGDRKTVSPMPEKELKKCPILEVRQGIGNPEPPHGTKERMSYLLKRGKDE